MCWTIGTIGTVYIKYELTKTCFLFTEQRLLKKPTKSALSIELITIHQTIPLVRIIPESDTVIIDFMAYAWKPPVKNEATCIW